MTYLGAVQGISEMPHFLSLLRKYYAHIGWNDFVEAWENIIFALIIGAFVSAVFYYGAQKRALIPTGFANFVEWLAESIQTFVVTVMGEKGKQFVPFLGTLFIYILGMNLIGLVPFMKAPTSSLNITLSLAIVVFFYVQYLNIKYMGVKGFLYHLAGSPKDAVGWMIVPLMLPIEILTQISRPFTLALRLFGNILGEKILIGFFVIVGATLLYYFPIQTPVMLFGVLTSMMQAMVFTLLTTIYIYLSLEHTEEHNH
jgi:F-type H+-transporting ATPase subunit a